MRLRAHARRRQSRLWWPALAVGVAAAGVTTTAPAARAQGFGLNEIGSCAIARAGAATGAPCEDASSLYWNPGALSNLPRGLSIYAAGAAIGINGSFTADVTGRKYEPNVPVVFPPFLGATYRPQPRLMVGIAGYVPYGLTSQWNSDFPGRFSAQKAAIQTFYFQPTAAYELIPGRLSVGAGLVFAYSRLELDQALDFSQSPVPGEPGVTFGQLGIQPGTEFGSVRVKGSGTGAGFTLGVHARPADWLSVGARYLSRVRIAYDKAPATFSTSARSDSIIFYPDNPLGLPGGTSLTQVVLPQFAPGAPLGPGQTASTVIVHPAQFQVGVGLTPVAGTTVSADYANIQWSAFNTLPVNFTTASGAPNALLSRTQLEQYKNSSSYRFSLEHRFPALDNTAARLGFSYIQTPAPDVTVTPLLPDQDRYNFSAGVGIPLGGVLAAAPGMGQTTAAGRRFMLDLSYLRVETQGRRGRTGERSDPALTAAQVNNGWYVLNANVFSAGLRATF